MSGRQLKVVRVPSPGRHAALAASLALVVALAAGCSGGSSGSRSGSGSEATLTWGTGTVTMFEAAPFVAMGLGIFKKYHLDVQFKVGPSAPPLLVSGAAQIIADRSADVPLLIGEGQSVKALGALAYNVPAGLLASDTVTSMAALQAMGNRCTIAAETSGIFIAYQTHWIQKYHLKCQVDTIQDYSLAVAGVVSGRYTAAVELLSNAGSVVAAKQARWLIDPRSADYQSSGNALPGSFINTALITTSAYLATHKDVAARFLKALQRANTQMQTMSNAAIASAIKASGAPYWASQSVQAIESQLTGNNAAPNVFALDHIGVYPISRQLWTDSLQNIKQQGITIDPSDPRFSYAQAVDDSVFSS
jgi:ABC-type nitrate/sulfonate/bicarbonate transport system substrate-binding protein